MSDTSIIRILNVLADSKLLQPGICQRLDKTQSSFSYDARYVTLIVDSRDMYEASLKQDGLPVFECLEDAYIVDSVHVSSRLGNGFRITPSFAKTLSAPVQVRFYIAQQLKPREKDKKPTLNLNQYYF